MRNRHADRDKVARVLAEADFGGEDVWAMKDEAWRNTYRDMAEAVLHLFEEGTDR